MLITFSGAVIDESSEAAFPLSFTFINRGMWSQKFGGLINVSWGKWVSAAALHLRARSYLRFHEFTPSKYSPQKLLPEKIPPGDNPRRVYSNIVKTKV